MATASPAALDLFIQRFTTQIDSGFGLISGDVQVILGTLVVISIALTAILWAIDETSNVLASLVRKVLLVGFFAWLVGSWQTLSATVVNGFARLGLRAGGGGSIDDFANAPTAAVDAGMHVVSDLVSYIGTVASQNLGMGAFMNLDVILIASVAAIGILLAFIILAIEIAVTIIEFHLVTLIAFVTVPFGVLTHTSFLAERSIGYVISVGLKMMALGVILGIGTNVFQTLTLSPEPTIGEECGLLLAALFLMMLALKVPSIAGALISGGPQLSSGSALMGAAGVAAGAAGVGLAARTAGGAVANGWAAGGEKIAAARAAAGATSSGGGSSGGAAASAAETPSGTGAAAGAASSGSARAASGDARGASAAGGVAQAASDFARAPVSTAVATGRSWATSLSGGSGRASAADSNAPSAAPEAPSPASTVASARARRPDGWAGAARTSAAAAAAATDSPGHGMPATPARRDDDSDRNA